MSEAGPVINNQQNRRFELDVDGRKAFIDYVDRDDSLDFIHTEVPEELEGKGIGSALVQGALNLAREGGAGVIPSCPFVAAYVRQHPDYLEVIDESYRHQLARGRSTSQ